MDQRDIDNISGNIIQKLVPLIEFLVATGICGFLIFSNLHFLKGDGIEEYAPIVILVLIWIYYHFNFIRKLRKAKGA